MKFLISSYSFWSPGKIPAVEMPFKLSRPCFIIAIAWLFITFSMLPYYGLCYPASWNWTFCVAYRFLVVAKMNSRFQRCFNFITEHLLFSCSFWSFFLFLDKKIFNTTSHQTQSRPSYHTTFVALCLCECACSKWKGFLIWALLWWNMNSTGPRASRAKQRLTHFLLLTAHLAPWNIHVPMV